MSSVLEQLHQTLAINTAYERALNEILAAKTIEEARAIAQKVLQG